MQRDYGDIVAVSIRVPEGEEDLDEAEDVAAVIEPPGAQAAPPPQEKEPGESEKQNAAKLVDMKGVAQPHSFSGDDAAWHDWRFRFQTIMALLDTREVMKLAAECPREIREDELSKESSWKGRMLYSLLVVLVSGRALGTSAGGSRVTDWRRGGAWYVNTNQRSPRDIVRYWPHS